MILFLKTHIDGYTKKDGTYVAPHEDSRRLFHGSYEHVKEIRDEGLFGGVFASAMRIAAASHGDVLHRIDLPASEIMTQAQIEDVSDDDLKAVARWVDDDDIDRLRELVVDEAPVDDDDIRILRSGDVGEASWEAQRLRGALAKLKGFKAVEMDDEHGTSYLVLPGASISRDDDGEMAKALVLLKASVLPPAERREWSEPTEAQAAAGNYRKPRIRWHGLEIAIENPAGSVRRGKGWETKMVCDYGYVCRSEAVDGDEVDVYLGPELETAPMVYVVHQRKKGSPDANEWRDYDEDKVMLGQPSEAAARAAYLKHYDDPRFLGPITAMPVEEFVNKVRETYDKPAMIKALFILPPAIGTARA